MKFNTRHMMITSCDDD